MIPVGVRKVYLIRGVAVWIGIRLALASPGLGVSNPNVAQEILLLGVVALIVFLDARRRREDQFLGNLGLASSFIALHALPLALVAELLFP
jgi:hypothetical protein